LAFAIGFGFGVLGAFFIGQPRLIGQPSDSGARLARAAANPSDDAGLAHAREVVPSATPAFRDPDLAARPASNEALAVAARDTAELTMLAGLPRGLSREAESAGQARIAKAAVSDRGWFTEQVTVRRGAPPCSRCCRCTTRAVCAPVRSC
jgi:hypothetical protein